MRHAVPRSVGCHCATKEPKAGDQSAWTFEIRKPGRLSAVNRGRRRATGRRCAIQEFETRTRNNSQTPKRARGGFCFYNGRSDGGPCTMQCSAGMCRRVLSLDGVRRTAAARCGVLEERHLHMQIVGHRNGEEQQDERYADGRPFTQRHSDSALPLVDPTRAPGPEDASRHQEPHQVEK